MNAPHRQAHWQNVYQTKDEHEVSWFQESPEISFELIESAGAQTSASIIDIGGGASRLVDTLLEAGFASVTVLDLSERALAASKTRLGAHGADVDWVVGDVTTWLPTQAYDVWHDRAAFHFLTEPNDQVTYAENIQRAVKKGGHVIIGTFALDGPERCSGLPVVRHDESSLGQMLGDSFELKESRRHDHVTPGGAVQKFLFCRFQRRLGS